MFQVDEGAVEVATMEHFAAKKLQLSENSQDILKYLSERSYPLPPSLTDESLAKEYDRVRALEQYGENELFGLNSQPS
jgi:hypothetical protein